MVPLFVLVCSFVVFAALGIVGVHLFTPWTAALRFALLAMFLLTASAHFTKRRAELVRMVPPGFPQPELVVTLTGLLELAGALGLLFAATRPFAAIGLMLLLIAMFPANVRAARAGLPVGGRPATPVGPRSLFQVVFLIAIGLAGFLPAA